MLLFIDVFLYLGTQYTVMRHSQNGSFYAIPTEGDGQTGEEGGVPTEDTRRLSLEDNEGAEECTALASLGSAGDSGVIPGVGVGGCGLSHWGAGYLETPEQRTCAERGTNEGARVYVCMCVHV